MAITIPEVKKIAELARIKLTPEEEARFAETISAVLEYMKILNEVDTSAVESTYQVTGLTGVVRPDTVETCTTRAELMAQLPQVEHDELIVPAVFE